MGKKRRGAIHTFKQDGSFRVRYYVTAKGLSSLKCRTLASKNFRDAKEEVKRLAQDERAQLLASDDRFHEARRHRPEGDQALTVQWIDEIPGGVPGRVTRSDRPPGQPGGPIPGTEDAEIIFRCPKGTEKE
jgi:hypothetical protein